MFFIHVFNCVVEYNQQNQAYYEESVLKKQAKLAVRVEAKNAKAIEER